MSIAMKRILIAGGLALVIGGTAIPLAQVPNPNPPCDWCVGDVFVATGVGKYQVWSNAGTKKQDIVIGSNLNPGQSAGCWFDSQFNLYTADSGNTQVFLHPLAGSHTAQRWVDTSSQANNGHSNSIVMAVNGDVYVGNPGGGGPAKSILRYRSDTAFLQKYQPATENGGIDWIDLATDQRTTFYTSAGRKIKRFNVGNNSQLADFATLSGTGNSNVARAIRLLPPFDLDFSVDPAGRPKGGLLVADTATIKRLNSSGGLAQTYDVTGEDSWRALNLDPDLVRDSSGNFTGHFWAAGSTSGTVYRFDIVTGAVDRTLNTAAASGAVLGLCVMGEAQLQIQPLKLSNTGSTLVNQDVTAPFGDPSAVNGTEFYSFSTWRLRIKVKPGVMSQNIIAAVSFTPQTTDKVCTPNTNDFDCRFNDANLIAETQCVPFFRDPSTPAATGPSPLERYRCGYYRVKDIPLCSKGSQSEIDQCPFAESILDFVPGTGPGSNDILSEILMNLTNPTKPGGDQTKPDVFDVSPYGPAPKGNPRLMRDPDSVSGDQFFIDATTAVIDWPAFGTGTPNDYSPVMRKLSTIGTGGGCVDIIKPDNLGQNAGSSMKLIIEVKDGPRDPTTQLCTGSPIGTAVSNGNNVSLAISNPDVNPPVLVIYCDTPGSSLGCFTPVNGQLGRYQSTLDLTNPPFIPSNQHAYFFAVTSVNVPTANAASQNSGQFPPTGRSFFICTNGSNCGS